jgi:hypothetical protein
LKEKLSREPSEIGGRKIEKINRIDGVKFIFTDGNWMLMRPSGTDRWLEFTPKQRKKKIWRCYLNKVAITYWNNTKAISLPAANRVKDVKRAENATPQWLIFTVVASMTLMLCMAINLRAYSEMSSRSRAARTLKRRD